MVDIERKNLSRGAHERTLAVLFFLILNFKTADFRLLSDAYLYKFIVSFRTTHRSLRVLLRAHQRLDTAISFDLCDKFEWFFRLADRDGLLKGLAFLAAQHFRK